MYALFSQFGIVKISWKVFTLIKVKGRYGYSLPFESIVQFISVTQLCLTLCNPMNCSILGFPTHQQFLELVQTHVH